MLLTAYWPYWCVRCFFFAPCATAGTWTSATLDPLHPLGWQQKMHTQYFILIWNKAPLQWQTIGMIQNVGGWEKEKERRGRKKGRREEGDRGGAWRKERGEKGRRVWCAHHCFACDRWIRVSQRQLLPPLPKRSNGTKRTWRTVARRWNNFFQEFSGTETSCVVCSK